LVSVNPVQYISDEAPSFLILHGEKDSAVQVEQAEILYQKLMEVDVNATLIVVENANHNFKPTGGGIKPSRERISILMANYFNRTLR
jgi:dipeptidyl aminopeptidase/acylaminoacyl peptidase